MRQTRKVGAPLAMIVIGWVIITWFITNDLTTNPAAFTVGAVPSLVALAIGLSCYLWLDQWEPEPPRMLIFAFVWGGGFAIVLTLIISVLLKLSGALPTGDIFFASSIQAPLVEEAAKGSFLVLLLLPRWRKEMVTLVDHLVYAGFVGFGFAFVENLMYFTSAESLQDTILMAVVRTGFNLFGHAFYTSATALGLYYGRRFGGGGRFLIGVLGYILAAGLHATWNGAATVLSVYGLAAVYLLILTPAFMLFVWAGIRGRKQEGQWIASQLPRMVDEGLLTERHAVWVADLKNRATMKRLLKGRARELVHLRNLMDAVIELSVLRNRSALDLSTYNIGEEQFLIDTILNERAATDAWIGDFLPPLIQRLPRGSGGWPADPPAAPVVNPMVAPAPAPMPTMAPRPAPAPQFSAQPTATPAPIPAQSPQPMVPVSYPAPPQQMPAMQPPQRGWPGFPQQPRW